MLTLVFHNISNVYIIFDMEGSQPPLTLGYHTYFLLVSLEEVQRDAVHVWSASSTDGPGERLDYISCGSVINQA